MSVKLLTEHHLELLSLKGGGCTGSSESTLFKMPHCWKSGATAHMVFCPFDRSTCIRGHKESNQTNKLSQFFMKAYTCI